jgi:hypothetical protein
MAVVEDFETKSVGGDCVNLKDVLKRQRVKCQQGQSVKNLFSLKTLILKKFNQLNL